ncbi:YceD family protein [Actinokineospora sp. NBRC 105648]|uniref:YceD family protein n=1 Tax=Actinokineospora sp. NBRC 105648 TaxID=3032206 RepID=UPI0024A5F113|nr:YceD family protein [Actinokineospora sp. NBRC 105648]GLZ43775.1 metal-binding protein [Actinokineospora sp. NBRC 105648]
MSSHRKSPTRQALNSPWVIDTRELGRRPGSSRPVRRTAAASYVLGLEGVIGVPMGAEVELDVLLESVMEGVLVTGTAAGPLAGECSRCLDPITDEVEVEITELFAYPDSATDETTDEDEVSRLVDDRLDLEPVVRDAVVLALPHVPLCTEDCAGLCAVCGGKWADLGADHRHETIDPRWAALQERFHQDPGQ